MFKVPPSDITHDALVHASTTFPAPEKEHAMSISDDVTSSDEEASIVNELNSEHMNDPEISLSVVISTLTGPVTNMNNNAKTVASYMYFTTSTHFVDKVIKSICG